MLQSVKDKLEELRFERGRSLEVGDIIDHSPSNPTLAEIIPGKTPAWYVIETHPNRERTAAAHLIARRFGVFVPEKEQTLIIRGRKVEQTVLMFRNYIFVFVWDIRQHIHKINAVPGVMRVLFVQQGEGREPKPAVLSDEKIDQIRAVENRERPLPAIIIPEHMLMPKKKGRWKKNQKALYALQQEQLKRDSEVVRCRPWSAFEDGIMSLDDDTRNQTLRNALGLAA
jgi:transcription antitermination factor NusG